jgi:hypothetical protein
MSCAMFSSISDPRFKRRTDIHGHIYIYIYIYGRVRFDLGTSVEQANTYHYLIPVTLSIIRASPSLLLSAARSSLHHPYIFLFGVQSVDNFWKRWKQTMHFWKAEHPTSPQMPSRRVRPGLRTHFGASDLVAETKSGGPTRPKLPHRKV